MTEKVIQFGEGNFLRGFADRFIHEMNSKGLFDGKAVVVQPRAGGKTALLNAQRCKYNLYLRGMENGTLKTEHIFIEAISRGVDPYVDFDEYIALADNPDFRFIISNTTEAGIAYDESCEFSDTPAVSFPGKLTQLLYRRFKNGLPGFILLPCELIDNNGDALKECVLKYAAQWSLGKEFTSWLEQENTFANTLVDQIVTGYPADEAEKLNRGDRLLDTAELFHLWVIEGSFEDEMPLRAAGFNVIWTDDVSPYKKRKVRILNGAHTSMVTGALLAGIETVGECMEDETVFAYLRHCLYDEILPVIGSNNDNKAFAADTLERFKNPYIRHQLRSIVMNSISKFSVRVLPTILEYKQLFGFYPKALSMSLALLIEFYKTDVPQDDAQSVEFIRSASLTEILSCSKLWGTDISDILPDIERCLEIIKSSGAKGAMTWATL